MKLQALKLQAFALLLWAGPAMADPPRLRGIVTRGQDRVAVVSGADGATVPVQEGDTVGGFAVRRILPDGVVLERGGTLVELGFDASRAPSPALDTGDVTFGLVVNPPAPAPD